jgi:hypothetical protein
MVQVDWRARGRTGRLGFDGALDDGFVGGRRIVRPGQNDASLDDREPGVKL